ncbi:MAG: YncE family protein [Candidatus Binatia bacterium]
MRHSRIPLALLLLVLATPTGAAQLFVAANHGDSGATVRSFRTKPPWSLRKPALEIGADSVLHARGNRLFVVSRRQGTVSVIARRAWAVRRTFSLGAASQPQDIVVLGRDLAFVTTGQSPHLLRFDPMTGTFVNAVDLSVFADDDGNPDLGRMIRVGTRLLVQVRRANEEAPGGLASPSYLAVVDLPTLTLVDVDPLEPGVQAIKLDGTAPKHRMQILAGTSRLFVSATGTSFDAGGIEEIDLDMFATRGLVVREDDGLTGADLGPFVLLNENRGYLVFTTDLTLSSHLDRFGLDTGVAENANIHVSVDYAVPEFGFDALPGLLFVPDGSFDAHGVHVFGVETDEKLTPTALDTGGPPTDVLVVRRR